MHILIRAIVYGKDKEEGLEQARSIFERLCECQHPFDYYSMFDEENFGKRAKDRWADLPAITLAKSKKGKELIREGMDLTKKFFMHYIKKVRKILDECKNDEELFEQRYINIDKDIRWNCYLLGENRGPFTYLYDNDGEGIKSPSHLKDVLNKWKSIYEGKGKSNPYKDKKIWVVPADMHF